MNKIPKGWEVKKLGEICEKISAGGDKPAEFSPIKTNDFKIPIYSNGIKDNGLYGYTKYATINKQAVTVSARGTIGFVCVRNEPFCPIVRLISAIPKDNILDLKFLAYALKFKIPSGEGSSIPQLTVPNFKQLKIPLPPLSEQKTIVDKLDDSFTKIENAITNLINAKENLKLYKQSVLKSAFNGDLLPNTSPTHWEVKKLGEICEKIGDGLHGTPSYNDDGEYFFINGRNISYPYLIINNNVKRLSSDEALKYKKDFNTHTIFVSINGTLGNIGFYNNEKIILGKSVCYLNLKDNVNKYYIFFNLKSNEFLNYANLKATGSTIKNVSLQAMRNFEIPLPPLSEQNLIAAEIDRRFAIVDKTLNLIDKSIQNAKNLKQSILKKHLVEN